MTDIPSGPMGPHRQQQPDQSFYPEFAPAPGSTFRTNAGSVAPGQTLKTFVVRKVALSTTLVTTIPLETVAAGKTLYITDIYFSHDSAAVVEYRIQAAGVDIFAGPVKGDTAPVQMAGMESQPSAAAGQQVNLVIAAAAGPPNSWAFIAGVEQ